MEWLRIRTTGDRMLAVAGGSWTADNSVELAEAVNAATPRKRTVRKFDIDMSGVEQLDTYGAWLLERLLRTAKEKGCEANFSGLDDRYTPIVEAVHGVKRAGPEKPREINPLVESLFNLGLATAHMTQMLVKLMQMSGALAIATLKVITNPSTFRLTSLVVQVDRTGWRAVPIIVLITFLIGAILAQQGIFHFRKFGADLFVVDMVGILVLRELGVLIVCIMVAGRSGSAYTAELGSMKMREEVDALQTMGFNPVDVLILPRVLALVISVPILTFIGSMAALYGGGLVAWIYGGIAPEVFLSRLRETITLSHFLVGLAKAPVMAMVVGMIACVDGLDVEGSAESLGQRTTSSVVKSIFFVIVLDGFFAIFFATVGI